MRRHCDSAFGRRVGTAAMAFQGFADPCPAINAPRRRQNRQLPSPDFDKEPPSKQIYLTTTRQIDSSYRSFPQPALIQSYLLPTSATMASTTPSSSPPALTATYNSPTNAPFTVTKPITTSPAPATTDDTPESKKAQVAAKTQHLASLRAAVSAAQDAINKELTARMEEDKARDAKTAGVDDAKAEENYGEEVAEEDD